MNIRPSYEKLLLPGEKVRSVASPHWAALALRLLWRVAELILLWIVAGLANAHFLTQITELPGVRDLGPDGGPLPLSAWVSKGCGWLAVVVIVLAAFDVLRWYATAYVLTDQRVIQAWGVLSLAAMDSPLDKVTDIGFEQSWLGRLLDYGHVLVLRNTEDGGNRLAAVAKPLAFKQALHKARQARTAPPVMAANNLQTALKELLALREHELVTPEEFETKKKELLARF